FLEGKVKRRPMIENAIGPDLTAVAANDPLNGGEANPGADELRALMQALERHEQLLRVRHIEPRSVVTNEGNPCAVLLGAPYFDPSGLAFCRELPGVADQ